MTKYTNIRLPADSIHLLDDFCKLSKRSRTEALAYLVAIYVPRELQEIQSKRDREL